MKIDEFLLKHNFFSIFSIFLFLNSLLFIILALSNKISLSANKDIPKYNFNSSPINSSFFKLIFCKLGIFFIQKILYWTIKCISFSNFIIILHRIKIHYNFFCFKKSFSKSYFFNIIYIYFF